METTAMIQPGRLDVQTLGGQLSKSTEWTLARDGALIGAIERVNWKWKFWSYRATATVEGQRIEAESDMSNGALTIHFRDASGGEIATASNRSLLTYHGAKYKLDGLESPDTVLDGAGTVLLQLRWQMQMLHHVDVALPLPVEFVVVATTACLLHERPTD